MVLFPARLTTRPTSVLRCRTASCLSAMRLGSLLFPQDRLDARQVLPQGTQLRQAFCLSRGCLEPQLPDLIPRVAKLEVQLRLGQFPPLFGLHATPPPPRLTNFVLMGSLWLAS